MSLYDTIHFSVPGQKSHNDRSQFHFRFLEADFLREITPKKKFAGINIGDLWRPHWTPMETFYISKGHYTGPKLFMQEIQLLKHCNFVREQGMIYVEYPLKRTTEAVLVDLTGHLNKVILQASIFSAAQAVAARGHFLSTIHCLCARRRPCRKINTNTFLNNGCNFFFPPR